MLSNRSEIVPVDLDLRRILVEVILSKQNQEGGWLSDPYYSAFFTRLLNANYDCVKDLNIVHKLKKAVNYLKCQLGELSNCILERKDLYYGLENFLRNFSEVSYTLATIGEKRSLKSAKNAFEKLEEYFLQYAESISDVSLIATFAKCYPYFKKPSDQVVRYLISMCISLEAVKDRLLVIETLFALKEKYYDIVSECWEDLRKRYPSYEITNIDDVLSRMARETIKNVSEKSNMETIYLAFSVARKMSANKYLKNDFERLYQLYCQKFCDFVTRLFARKIITEGDLLEAGYLLAVLTFLPQRTALLIFSNRLDIIKVAVSCYNSIKTSNAVILKKSRYHGLMIYSYVMTACLIGFIFLYLGMSWQSIFFSIFLGISSLAFTKWISR